MSLKESRLASADHTSLVDKVTLPSATNFSEGLAVNNADSIAVLCTGKKPYGISQGSTKIDNNAFLTSIAVQGDRIPVQTEQGSDVLDKGQACAFEDGLAVQDDNGIYTVIERDESFSFSDGNDKPVVFIQLR